VGYIAFFAAFFHPVRPHKHKLFPMNDQFNLEPGEIVLRESKGNFRQNSKSLFGWVGGKWFLTNKRIIFQSNWTNFESRKESIYLKDVTSIDIKYHDFLSSKLTVFLKSDSAVIELHVKERRQWRDDILTVQNCLL
jgi:hypothetical protein